MRRGPASRARLWAWQWNRGWGFGAWCRKNAPAAFGVTVLGEILALGVVTRWYAAVLTAVPFVAWVVRYDRGGGPRWPSDWRSGNRHFAYCILFATPALWILGAALLFCGPIPRALGAGLLFSPALLAFILFGEWVKKVLR